MYFRDTRRDNLRGIKQPLLTDVGGDGGGHRQAFGMQFRQQVPLLPGAGLSQALPDVMIGGEIGYPATTAILTQHPLLLILLYIPGCAAPLRLTYHSMTGLPGFRQKPV